jgi:hypothetical protein
MIEATVRQVTDLALATIPTVNDLTTIRRNKNDVNGTHQAPSGC